MPESHRITTLDALREIYRDPSKLVVDKERPDLDEGTKQFLRRARFFTLGTSRLDGSVDVSPRGGEEGFVNVLDDHHIAIADFGGNNRIDSMRNILETGHVGMLFIAPGKNETVRVNGEAWITNDPELLTSFPLPRRPRTAIVVRVTATFIHCAKAFRRSGMWDPDVWASLDDAPDAADILVSQAILDPSVTAELIRADLDRGYDTALAWEGGAD